MYARPPVNAEPGSSLGTCTYFRWGPFFPGKKKVQVDRSQRTIGKRRPIFSHRQMCWAVWAANATFASLRWVLNGGLSSLPCLYSTRPTPFPTRQAAQGSHNLAANLSNPWSDFWLIAPSGHYWTPPPTRLPVGAYSAFSTSHHLSDQNLQSAGRRGAIRSWMVAAMGLPRPMQEHHQVFQPRIPNRVYKSP